MDESTTKPVAPEGQAPVAEPTAPAQPEPEQPSAAEQQPEDPQQPDSDQPQPEEPAPADNSQTQDEFDYEAWLSAKGIDPSTPEGKAAIAKSWREMEKKMHQTTQQASELEKQIQADPATTDDDRVQRLELLYNANTWKQSNRITPEQDEAMGTYLTSNPEKLQLVKHGLLSFDDVLAMSGAAKVDTAAIKQQGGQEALQRLAHKQLATAPAGGATTRSDPPKEDPIMAGLKD